MSSSPSVILSYSLILQLPFLQAKQLQFVLTFPPGPFIPPFDQAVVLFWTSSRLSFSLNKIGEKKST